MREVVTCFSCCALFSSISRILRNRSLSSLASSKPTKNCSKTPKNSSGCEVFGSSQKAVTSFWNYIPTSFITQWIKFWTELYILSIDLKSNLLFHICRVFFQLGEVICGYGNKVCHDVTKLVTCARGPTSALVFQFLQNKSILPLN